MGNKIFTVERLLLECMHLVARVKALGSVAPTLYTKVVGQFVMLHDAPYDHWEPPGIISNA